MPAEFTQVDDAPMFILRPSAPFDFEVDTREVREAIGQFLAQTNSPTVFRIADLRGARLSLFDIMTGLASGAAAADPRERFLIVGSGTIAEAVARGLGQRQFGARGARLFTEMDDAIAYARAEVAAVHHAV